MLQEYQAEPFWVSFREGSILNGVRKEYQTQYTFRIYENENYIPMGFRYDTYMTEEDFEQLPVEERSYALLRTLIVSEREAVEKDIDTYLHHITLGELENLDERHMERDIIARKENASCDFTYTTSGFCSQIDCDGAGLVFFSVPYDFSWKAAVNGEKVEIVYTNGFMAVPVEAGKNEIRFVYRAYTNMVGMIISILSLLCLAVYVIVMKKGGSIIDVKEK